MRPTDKNNQMSIYAFHEFIFIILRHVFIRIVIKYNAFVAIATIAMGNKVCGTKPLFIATKHKNEAEIKEYLIRKLHQHGNEVGILTLICIVLISFRVKF